MQHHIKKEPYGCSANKRIPQAQRKKGFALVASLTLMMLLGLLAVGVLSVASTQNRLAAHAALQAEARQQALIGLDAALAEMQMALGPDQRVTANSSILAQESDTCRHILGVWNSWPRALYDQSQGSIQSTYGEGRASQFRRWLISSRTPEELSQFESAQKLGTRNPGFRICLVGEGTLGRNAEQSDYVYADLVEMPASGKNTAAFAWWVCGENQKANICIPEREPATDETEILSRTWDTPSPSFAYSAKLSHLDLPAEDKEKLLSRQTLAIPRAAGSDHATGFHDATIYSYSLPTNVRDGGLKHDLNLLLNKKDLRSTPFAARTHQDCPLAEDAAIPPGTESNMPIGSWQTLHAYYNTWPDGSASDNSNFSARLCGTVKDAYARMSGRLVEKTISTKAATDKVTLYDTRSVPGDSQAGYARVPVMLAFLGAHGLAIGEPQHPYSRPAHYSYGLTYAPFVQWWNPYNVPMRVGGKKLWTYSLPYRTTSIMFYAGKERRWARWLMYQPRSNQTETPSVVDNAACGQRNTFANDWGNYFVNAIDDQESDIIFEPGEILVFSMSETFNNLLLQNQSGESGNDAKFNTTSLSQPQAVPFTLGDHGGKLNNYFISMYSYLINFGATLKLSLESNYLYNYAVQNKHIYSRIDENDGMESEQQYLYDTIGEVVGPRGREIFSVIHGYDGIDASEKANQSLKDSRLSSKANRFFGARGISPNHFSLGWYDYDEPTDEIDLMFCGQEEGYTWTPNMALYEPTYFAAVGIVPKSYHPATSELLGMFREKDYRTKVWQHSNPALGSSALYKPDDQERQYNPFQLAALRMGSGLGRGLLDTLSNRNGVYGTVSAGNGGGESVSFISSLELPLHPPFSLAGFAGMRLTPGWFSSGGGDDSIAEMRRVQYQAGVPGVGIGNSFADPCLPPNGVYTLHTSNIDTSVHSNKKIFSDFYDHALLINDALWDRWFCSSVSDMPSNAGKRTANKTLEAFISGDTPLPVSRYKKNYTGMDDKQVIQRIMADDGWMHIARYLWIEGGFNINSTSEEAWAATLSGLARRELLSNASGRLRRIEKSAQSDVLFSRFMVSTSNQPIDSYSYDPLEGSSTVRPNLKYATAWGEVRALSQDDIRELAREIVKKVRERGPFLNMSDFINRRLDGGSEHALTGALQAAIDATNINQVFNAEIFNIKAQKNGSLYKFTQAAEGSMYTAAPGYLIQSDVLASLGNILTVRDDTFTVRAYGCVRNSRRAVLAQAWCEATVQRTIDYVDSAANAPEDSDRPNTGFRAKNTPPLSDLNRVMGRKLKVISFRWLDSWDI